jgi:hypothetical protein
MNILVALSAVFFAALAACIYLIAYLHAKYEDYR